MSRGDPTVHKTTSLIPRTSWYWWADVAVQPREHVYALPGTVRHGSPSVQYRGIFINDEAPALTDWAHEKFGPVYNSEFYKMVFELLLRMKAS